MSGIKEELEIILQYAIKRKFINQGECQKLYVDILKSEELIEVRGKSEGKRTLKLPVSKLNCQTYIYIKKAN